ncbi:MAG: class I SAM-dependent methyltransferase, partial [Chloroflexota bacterium]
MSVDIHPIIPSSYHSTSHQLSTMKLDLHYVEPRLVQLYDTDNPLGIDSDFYLQLADELDAKLICDLGCGTGLLTRKLATDNRQVFGIDPASEMLDFAKQQTDADRVTWIKGDASSLALHNVDLTIMTGNVAQVFLDDEDWQFTLSQISKATKPGGTLAFESRNPA